MLAAVIHGARDVRAEERPDPVLRTPHDAVVRVVAACVCGSDLWPYRGVTPTREPHPIGHELVGVVEELGAEVTSAQVGDFVILPFSLSCGRCQSCRAGFPAACDVVTFFGSTDRDGHPVDGAQGQKVRIPLAQHSLFPVGLSEQEVEARGLVPHLLALADVMSTGMHAAVSAGVREGDVVAVVGDGAVGLSGVIAAKLLGAARIVAMSRHQDRTALARAFGATDVVAERGPDAPAAIRALLDGNLADAALECVGTQESMAQALAVVRGGGRIGFVGVPNGGPELPVRELFSRNLTVGGGMASARRYMAELLPHVLSGAIEPGRVFDLTLPLAEIAEAYAAMDERRATKVLVRP
ncbi:Alcohol dehydrogenase GroES domain protein [Xylanimonas cellulosilytica DSM 15894]|uniref:Alcohol dehydrogenase GroES domain protein n=1 Tax=Xylanimonas cellulosilytica (strain DSM 15894 / JCM 12276 / CECT 5975 / KCTC 9989 / LMG 20990 / NBRC 107835 / XIL07) TaxID=446471 RepID=D1BZA7_XYLCX|nr:alcohol dehydrogenase catalytic domain-containing protein [Xylanimonas cellulosilytica]ACZ32004.1 Alcohol dehydrogenase GroES domain protein [Xylanimonas cellulosilytica DSM 15894]